MLKHYISAFLKANIVTLLIFGYFLLIRQWEESRPYHFWIWVGLNLFFQCTKISYVVNERVEDEWDYIRLTEGKKWWERYLDDDIKKRLDEV